MYGRWNEYTLIGKENPVEDFEITPYVIAFDQRHLLIEKTSIPLKSIRTMKWPYTLHTLLETNIYVRELIIE